MLQLAHRLGAPVITDCRAKGLLTAEEPLSLGVVGHFGTPLANEVLSEADTILAGALHQALAAHAPFLIDVAVDPSERQSTAIEPAPEKVRA